MSMSQSQKDKLRRRILYLWEDQRSLPLENLRRTLRQYAPWKKDKDMEKWMDKHIVRYYQLRKAELDALDDEHIRKVLRGAGFLP